MSWLRRATARVLKRIWPGREWLSDVGVLAGGTAAAQALAVIAAPLLTRLYSPGEFGVLAVFVSILGVCAVVSTLRYEVAIPLPTRRVAAASVLAASLASVFVTTAFTGLIFGFFDSEIGRLTGTPEVAPYLWLVPIGVLGAGVYKTFNYWAIRRQAFGPIARTRVSQSVGKVATQGSLGLLGVGPMGLVLGSVVDRTLGGGTLGLFAWHDGRDDFSRVSSGRLKWAISRYRRFPLFSAGAGLLNESALRVPPVLISGLYGAQSAGWFILTERATGLPLNLIAQSVAQVYMSRAPRLLESRSGELKQLFWTTSLRLVVIGSIPAAVLAIGGPLLFGLVFGGEWTQAGIYARILAALFLVRFVVTPLSQTLNILEWQDVQMYWDGGRLLVTVAALVIPKMLGAGDIAAIASFSIAGGLMYLVLFGITWYSVDEQVKAASTTGG